MYKVNSFSLKQARLYRVKTQADMARLLGIHIETYRKLEINQNMVTIEQAKVICEFLDIPYDAIFFAE